MNDAVNGPRGTDSYSQAQRPGNFSGGIKRSRVTRDDIEESMREVHNNVPANVKKTGKTGKAKEKMIRAIGMSKARAKK
jgi:hypothetical protein